MKRERVVTIVAALLAGALTLDAGARMLERTGYAYKMGGDKLLYTEEHEEWVEDGTVARSTVTYRDASGNVIAVKRLDFSGDPVNPDFRLESTATGHVEAAEQDGDECTVTFRKSGEHEYETATVELPDQAIIDGGFDRFIEINWERLMDGDVFKRPFLVPSFQRFVDFKIYVENETDTEVVLVMEPASFLLRIVGDGIVVSYNREDASLKRYEGISNIRDSSGENYDVRVEFRKGGLDSAAAPGDAER